MSDDKKYLISKKFVPKKTIFILPARLTFTPPGILENTEWE
jgi:hypothetical protein